jgi:hypothetical protein
MFNTFSPGHRILFNNAQVATSEHIINCDTDPFIPDGLRLLPKEEQLPNRVRGPFQWNPAQVKLHRTYGQRKNQWIIGIMLLKQLMDMRVLTANVLDYLLANPSLIPHEWKSKGTFFWGTIYCDHYGNPCIRYLFWQGSRRHWEFYWLSDLWYDFDYAAIKTA